MSGHRRFPTLTRSTIDSASGVTSYIAVFVDDYVSASLQMMSNSAVGQSIAFEVSNDAGGDYDSGVWDGVSGNWKAIQLQRSNSSTLESTLTINADTAYGWHVPLNGWRWFRIRCSAITSGSTTWSIKPQYNPIALSPTTSQTISGGQSASGAAVSGNPVRVAGQARTTNYTAIASGSTADLITTAVGALIVKNFSIPELDWAYVAASGGISNTTTPVTIKNAAGAGFKNYITGLQIYADTLGTATEVAIRDGSGGTVLWRHKIATTGISGLNIIFTTPLKGTANTLLEVVTLTASGVGAVYVNAQGYSAP